MSEVPSRRAGRPESSAVRGPAGHSVLSRLSPIQRESTPSRIASEIRAAITDGRLSPGTQLTEIPLADRLGVSRGPIREAVQRLIQEGLLLSDRHRGVFVVNLEPAEILDLYLTREIIETAVGQRIALGVARHGALDGLKRALESLHVADASGGWKKVVEADLRFHATLVASGGTVRLRRTFDTLSVETRICLNRLEPFYPQRHQVVAEHEAIYRALETGDAAGVAQQIHQHMTESAVRLSAAQGTSVSEPSHEPT